MRVVAAAQDPHEFDFGSDMMAWTLAMGHSMVRAGLAIKGARAKPWRPDVVHAHDWLVAHPAIALAEYFDVPLVSTIHATEAGRHSGWVSGAISRQVHAVESWLVRESDTLITCSASMSDEIAELFGPGLAETRVIRNGIDAARWPFAKRRPRTGPAHLMFLGRLEYEKGIHDLIAALPRIRRTHPGTTLTVAGTGTQQEWLVEQARKHKVLKATTFAGHFDHEQLVQLAAHRRCRRAAESLRAVRHRCSGSGRNGHPAGDLQRRRAGRSGDRRPDRYVVRAPRCCRTGRCRRVVLDDPDHAQSMATAARERLTSAFDWHTVADETAEVYLAAKRGEREPHRRRTIVEHALPDR